MTPTRRISALLAGVVAVVLLTAGAATAKQSDSPSVVPAQIHFVKPPLGFGWTKVMTYKLDMESFATNTNPVRVSFYPYLETKNIGPPKGGVWYSRHYTLDPGTTTSIVFRVRTPKPPSYGNFVSYCVYATIEVEGAGTQGATSCSTYDTSNDK